MPTLPHILARHPPHYVYNQPIIIHCVRNTVLPLGPPWGWLMTDLGDSVPSFPFSLLWEVVFTFPAAHVGDRVIWRFCPPLGYLCPLILRLLCRHNLAS